MRSCSCGRRRAAFRAERGRLGEARAWVDGESIIGETPEGRPVRVKDLGFPFALALRAGIPIVAGETESRLDPTLVRCIRRHLESWTPEGRPDPYRKSP